MKHIVTLIILLIVNQWSLATETITLGERVSFYSKILKEKRSLLIALPTSYKSSPERSYPVLYTLDGDTHFRYVAGTVHWLNQASNYIPETIVVALPNTDRARDMHALAFVSSDGEKRSGGAKNFIKFLGQELIPYVDKHYRTLSYRMLMGHSSAGRLTLDAFISETRLFNAYIAMSPWLGTHEALKDLIDRADQQKSFDHWSNRFLFLSIGNEPELKATYDKMISYLKNKAPDSLMLHSQEFLQDTHMSIATQTLHNALQTLFFDYHTLPEHLKDVASIKQHHKKVALKYEGLQISTEDWLNSLGYRQLDQSNIQAALKTFTINTKDYPNSANTFDSLADAYLAKGELKKAVKLLEKAVDLAKKFNDPRLNAFRGRLTEYSLKLKKDS